ncbi:MAG: OmpA family protein [Bacteroidetes bacterium]|nr:OmpA family protein [Bacteroidota bacterium]
MRILLRSLLISCALVLTVAAQQKDDRNCTDHPLFTRMPDSWIHSCTEKEFDSRQFIVGTDKKETIEGKLWRINYYPQASLKIKPSEVQILRNYENAVQKIGGTIVWKGKGKETFRLTKDGKDIWVEVTAEFTGKYGLTIVERAAMRQDIVADANAFLNELRTTGHASVYGILFDTGKSELKPESNNALEEITKLMKMEPSLKLYVVGHTVNIGGLDYNMRLSQDRAEAVVQALVRERGVDATRLKSFGNGPYAPVATNETEEGRAKNRRVELVKQ